MGHLRNGGFTVVTNDTTDMDAVKFKHGVPATLQSCHTALAGGYVIEGHVAADLIDRLLRERPKIVGLAVPGMPAGSPGMEVPAGQKPERYEVYAFDARGGKRLFASR